MEAEGKTMLNYTIKVFVLLAIPFVFGCAVLEADSRAARQSGGRRSGPHRGAGRGPWNALLRTHAAAGQCAVREAQDERDVSGQPRRRPGQRCGKRRPAYFFRSILVAAFTTLFSYVIAFAYGYGVVARDWRIDYDLGAVGKSILAAAAMALVVVAVTPRSPQVGAPALAALCALGVTVYGGGLMALRTFSGKEIVFLRRLIA